MLSQRLLRSFDHLLLLPILPVRFFDHLRILPARQHLLRVLSCPFHQVLLDHLPLIASRILLHECFMLCIMHCIRLYLLF
jgi:hypothetical protein